MVDLFIGVFLFLSPAHPIVPKLLPEASHHVDSIIVYRKRYIYNAGGVKCNFSQSYPQVHYINHIVERKINKAILIVFKKQTCQNEQCDEEYTIPHYKTYVYRRKILSVMLEMNTMSKGAQHGFSYTSVLNFDLRTGNTITADFIFKKSSIDLLTKKINDLTQSQLDSLSSDSIKVSGVNLSPFSFSDDGLIFYIKTEPQQEIEILIYYNKLKPYLKEKYR